jgi:hypothetical protein
MAFSSSGSVRGRRRSAWGVLPEKASISVDW